MNWPWPSGSIRTTHSLALFGTTRSEENHINEAVRDLEQSIELNDNRRVYRSAFLLDQDRAVRSSSLANVYQSAGLREASVRESARAVSDDYANASAHLFLSDSYSALRDPARNNLRYETPWFAERLLAYCSARGQHSDFAEYLPTGVFAAF